MLLLALGDFNPLMYNGSCQREIRAQREVTEGSKKVLPERDQGSKNLSGRRGSFQTEIRAQREIIERSQRATSESDDIEINFQLKNKCFAEMRSGSEEGSY